MLSEGPSNSWPTHKARRSDATRRAGPCRRRSTIRLAWKAITFACRRGCLLRHRPNSRDQPAGTRVWAARRPAMSRQGPSRRRCRRSSAPAGAANRAARAPHRPADRSQPSLVSFVAANRTTRLPATAPPTAPPRRPPPPSPIARLMRRAVPGLRSGMSGILTPYFTPAFPKKPSAILSTCRQASAARRAQWSVNRLKAACRSVSQSCNARASICG